MQEASRQFNSTHYLVCSLFKFVYLRYPVSIVYLRKHFPDIYSIDYDIYSIDYDIYSIGYGIT